MLDAMQLVSAAGGTVSEWHDLDAGSVEEPLDPCFGREIELDMPGIDE